MKGDIAADILVCMGTYAIARGPTVLKATLGSCVGLTLVWRAQGLFALAHCLLPEAPGSSIGPGARYVDQAVRTLLDEMQIPRDRRSELEVHLCGGAHMGIGDASGQRHLHVGLRNIEAAHRALALERLDLRSAELGGHCARRLIVDAGSGRITTVQVATAHVGPGMATRAIDGAP